MRGTWAKDRAVVGLECCVNRDCMGCPYFANGGSCQTVMRRDALALIQRQDARIRKLTKHELKTLQGQVKAGDEVGALKGLAKLLRRKGETNG